jgi:hypothetical protein
MNSFDESNPAYPTIDGKNLLTQSLQDYTYDKKTIDSKLGISEQTLNEISVANPNNGPVDMNNQRIENLSTLDVTSLDTILATPNSACNVTTTSNLITGNLLLSTAYCGPLSSNMNVKGKIITNMADMILHTVDDTPTAITRQTPARCQFR